MAADLQRAAAPAQPGAAAPWPGRVVLYHNMVAPYRHPLFTELARRVDLQVWFSVRATRDRKWSLEVPDTYSHRFLDGWSMYAFNRPLIVCPGVVRDLERARPDAVIAVLTRSNAIDVLRICRWGRRAGVPVVLWVGAVEPDPILFTGVPRLVDRAFERYFASALRMASGYVYYSDLSREWSEARGARGPFAIGTQVMPDRGVAPRVEPNPPEADYQVLFVGKLEHRKGFDLLTEAMTALPAGLRERVLFRVVGDGPQEDLLPGLADAGVRCEFLGHIDRERLWEIYRDADLTALPSRYDPWANVLNESMSMGTPVLISRQAGGGEFVARAGWVCDAGDPRSVTDMLRTAIEESRDGARRQAAVDAEREYRPGPSAQRIADLLRSVARAGAA
ncbi:glycosyltransferase [Longimicrobium terrae]|uniref:Glycosyltransferase involved in cell wall biosynthesis n=1 Tax=Longimicrobium terrae TaxID=1639882 RepID=A0A841GMN7_9BACT|nr:glycosyltransferase involved in cell wall biosynthesis [Longimicrobium terrae]MBB6068572.1 glycosyltransferase involved in cell wall biosynthesis [Longimicrobium terrae]NNC27759.1 glycosyltransferase family 4 protein [Longimicrobium terrae]